MECSPDMSYYVGGIVSGIGMPSEGAVLIVFQDLHYCYTEIEHTKFMGRETAEIEVSQVYGFL